MCKTCNEFLHCGRNGYLYSTQDNIINLNCFIVKHANHFLHFNGTDDLFDRNYSKNSKRFSIEEFAKEDPLTYKKIVEYQNLKT